MAKKNLSIFKVNSGAKPKINLLKFLASKNMLKKAKI